MSATDWAKTWEGHAILGSALTGSIGCIVLAAAAPSAGGPEQLAVYTFGSLLGTACGLWAKKRSLQAEEALRGSPMPRTKGMTRVVRSRRLPGTLDRLWDAYRLCDWCGCRTDVVDQVNNELYCMHCRDTEEGKTFYTKLRAATYSTGDMSYVPPPPRHARPLFLGPEQEVVHGFAEGAPIRAITYVPHDD